MRWSVQPYWFVHLTNCLFFSVKLMSEEFGCTPLALDDIDKVMDDEEVNAVIVCTPSRFHKEVVLKALNANKHVFCEKPLALNYLDTLECANLATSKSLCLYTGK